MMFKREYIKEIFQKVENYHNKNFYDVFLESIPYPKDGASEYELYINYIYDNHFDNFNIRYLHWANNKPLTYGHYYICNHWHNKNRELTKEL